MTATESIVKEDLLATAENGINGYLKDALDQDRIDQQLHDFARASVFPNLEKWLQDPEVDRVSPALKPGVEDAIRGERWEELVNAYRQYVPFGTGGIRAMMAYDRDSIRRLKDEGFNASILKGPNTINELLLLLTSAGVAAFGKDQTPAFSKVVIGCDCRIRGMDLAQIVAELFLANGYTVYFFDEPVPYPEVTFAIPDALIRADVGIFISASHNDYRYNGYKLSCGNGSQFDPKQRDEMYEQYIRQAAPGDIELCPFSNAPSDKLIFLGGDEPLDNFDYAGREDALINLHARHRDHVRSFLLTPDLAQRQQDSDNPLKVGYCAFHGAGTKAVPRLLSEVGIRDSEIRKITHNDLDKLNGLFPCFSSDPGREQQPDPGDPHAADIAVDAFKQEFPGEFENTDIVIGTDPDADRTGVVVKVPANQQHLYDGKDYMLLPADDMWALVVWYRLRREMQDGLVADADQKFIVLSHTTSDSITRVARKYGLGIIKTWVGFAALAAGVRDVWEGKPFTQLTNGRESRFSEFCHPFICEYEDMDNGKRSFNVAAMEQSNGFSILGGPPPDARSLGTGGHVRDKDGTFASLLVAEIAAWAKEQGTTLFELIDREIYLDPDVGLFVNFYEPDPLIGEYPGIEGDRKKLAILRRALGYFQLAMSGDLEIGGTPVKSACIFRTGKYDRIYPKTYDFEFPDEGIRFFFDDTDFVNHLTVRPSGTGNSLRFHIQLHADVTSDNLIEEKGRLHKQAEQIGDHIRELLKAPRS